MSEPRKVDLGCFPVFALVLAAMSLAFISAYLERIAKALEALVAK